MQHIFRAIAELRKVKTKNKEIKTERDSAIRRLREVIRDKLYANSYFLTAEEIKRAEEFYWRFRNKEKDRKPIFRKAQNGSIININGNYYIDSIKEALKEGSPCFLRSKDLYYKVGPVYYHKDEYFLVDGELYSKSEYELIDGKICDKTLVNDIYCYDNVRRDSIYEKYRLNKKPIPIDKVFNEIRKEDTEAVVTVYLDAQDNCTMLSNCFKYKDNILRRGINSVLFDNKWLNTTYKICIPIEKIEDFKFEVPQEIIDCFEKIKNKLKSTTNFKTINRYQVYFGLETAKPAGKKFKILKSVFEKIGYTRTTNINSTFKMIKDIMEVNL